MTRPPLDFSAINLHADNQAQLVIETLAPGGKWQGREYTALNPTRPDNKKGSFKINASGVVWSDFSTGDGGSGAISLAIYTDSLEPYAAAEKIAELIGYEPGAALPEAPKEKKSDIQIIMPVPGNAPPVPDKFGKLGIPSNIYPYRTTEGKLNGYILRFDKPGGKDIMPLTFNSEGKWQMKQWPVPRPLYGLESLPGKKNVIIVEGEKCVDMLSKAMPGVSVISWPGGSKALSKANFSLITGVKVVLWPDADEPGWDAMINIGSQLSNQNCQVRIVSIENQPKGYDCADLIEDKGNPAQYIKHNIQELPGNEVGADSVVAENAPSSDPVPNKGIFDGAPFKMLGYVGTTLYFMPDRGLQVVSFSGGQLSHTSLIFLAKAQWWEKRFPASEKAGVGVNTKAALNALIDTSYKIGVYNDQKLRGCGAWFDRGRVVLHVGDRLVVDEKKTRIQDFDTTYIYEKSDTQYITNNKPLRKGDAYQLQQISDRLQWQKNIFSKLFTGWCVVAPICGALDWRPHIWLTGTAGSGKTWTINQIMRPLLGQFSMVVQASTTEAGIRQKLGSNAFPIIFDEAEGNDKNASQRIQNVLELARQASAESGAAIVKGSSQGRAQSFRIRSCFCMSSISVGIEHNADASRITVLDLDKNNSPNALDMFEELRQDVASLMSRDFCASFRARSIRLIPNIRKNAETFSRAVAIKFGSKRAGDQLGVLLAGSYTLVSDGAITYKDAKNWIDDQDWETQEPDEEESDEIKLLNYLMQANITVTGDTSRKDRSLAQLIGTCKGLQAERETRANAAGAIPDIQVYDARGTLLSQGVKVEDDFIWFSNNHNGIKKILKETPWAINWGRILERIDGAKKRVQRYEAGIQTRSVGIPHDVIFRGMV